MRYLALACDYDGTLAHHGQVSSETIAALEPFVDSGRKLILVTGRQLPDLFSVFSRSDLFEWIVAENGALLYRPSTREKKLLANPLPAKFVAKIEERGVPVSVGDAIVATWHPHENIVLDTIRELGLELQVIFNKGAVMVLPSGTSKASGLSAALNEMGLSPHNVIGVGDAENDHALLELCGCAVAVANALPALKEKADFVTAAADGAGVTELITEVIDTDLSQKDGVLKRHHILLGTRENGEELRIPPFSSNLLLVGSSSSKKQAAATAFVTLLYQQGYQFCFIDPCGKYDDSLEGSVALGRRKGAPSLDQVTRVMKNPGANAIVDLSGVAASKRGSFFMELLATLQELRGRSGHPHWIIINEAQQLLDPSVQAWSPVAPGPSGMMYITDRPTAIGQAALSKVNTILAVDDSGTKMIEEFAAILDKALPDFAPVKLKSGEVVVWLRGQPEALFKVNSLMKEKGDTPVQPGDSPQDNAPS